MFEHVPDVKKFLGDIPWQLLWHVFWRKIDPRYPTVAVLLVRVKYISRLLIWQKVLRSVWTSFKKSSSVLLHCDVEHTPKMTPGWMDKFWMFLGSCEYFLCKRHLLEPILASGSSRMPPRHEKWWFLRNPGRVQLFQKNHPQLTYKSNMACSIRLEFFSNLQTEGFDPWTHTGVYILEQKSPPDAHFGSWELQKASQTWKMLFLHDSGRAKILKKKSRAVAI